ncbi:MAG: sigma 54-interacting transcriptional regulator, partial [Desulfobacteraceae bacterium]|nr:sigma 54-interacting transcriptional regulator [Desulfobacteraceae bacterium]
NEVISERYSLHNMIGREPAMQRVFELARMVSGSDATVIIEGPTGTGKDLLAKVIHSQSRRAERPFVKVNCAAVPENLLESEFFGYAKGAFTGAERNKPGRFQLADGGTIFLDEIGDLPLALQAKLLRVLEDREFYPLGSRQTVRVDVRIVSATNLDLERMVAQGRFREDLFYRLNVMRIELPPLCQRRADIPLLIRHILRRLSAARASRVSGISKAAFEVLLNYSYPGNVRELENILEHALIVCQGEEIRRQHLPDYVQTTDRRLASSRSVAPLSNAGSEDEDRLRIRDALQRSGGRRSQAARLLGIDRTTLWRRIRRLGLNDDGL